MEELLSYLVALILLGAVASWVYQDGLRRGLTSGTALFWSVMSLLCMILFLPLYLVIRPKLPGDGLVVGAGFRVCPRCNLANPSDCNFCKDCGTGLRYPG